METALWLLMGRLLPSSEAWSESSGVRRVAFQDLAVFLFVLGVLVVGVRRTGQIIASSNELTLNCKYQWEHTQSG